MTGIHGHSDLLKTEKSPHLDPGKAVYEER